MSNILQNIISLFSSTQINSTDIQEDYSELKIEVICSDGKLPSEKDFLNAISEMNNRDSLHISLRENGAIVENYETKNKDSFDEYISTCSDCLNRGNFTIILTIAKDNHQQRISVYYPDVFFEYLSNLSFNYFLDVLKKSFNNNDYIIFELQEDSLFEFETKSIHFISKDKLVKREEIVDRKEKLSKIKNLCYCPIVLNCKFIPDDFKPIRVTENTKLKNLFNRATLIYSTIFLFDIINIDSQNHFQYKLNGYRTINQQVDISYIDTDSFEKFYEIYSWVYESGNIIDKIGLARNILSLNFNKESLKLSETTFDAIKSGYNIYLKENIKQYIEIRNKISDQLIELQSKADRIVDSFIGDYKKSIFTFVSFFVTVLVIRVISKGDFVGGFSKEVTLLSVSFLLISLLIMCYSYWEINKQLERYKDFYKNLKERHEDLLDKSDIERILNNDKDYNSVV